MSVANPQSAIPNPQSAIVNVAARMTEYARESPHQIAVAETAGRDATGKYRYRQVTYGQLEEDSNRLASGLQQLGVEPGTRMVLLVRPGIDFISLVFALFKVGAVVVLVDPGMGRKNLVRCLADTRPEGFIAVPQVHAVRTLLRRRFPKSRIHVTAGRRWFWGGVTLEQLRGTGSPQPLELVRGGSDPAAIIFTTGSTGVPKGVLYCHSNFDQQVAQIQQRYGIEPGTVDLAAFPLFGLFNNGMGATTIVPDMDATRPASVDPQDFLTVAHRLECDAVVCVASAVASCQPLLRTQQRPHADISPITFRRCPRAGPRFGQAEGSLGGRRSDSYSVRRDRGLAGGVHQRDRSSERNTASN